jgi:hypothetical protein
LAGAKRTIRLALATLAIGGALRPAQAMILDAPFDFSQGAIGLDMTVRGAPLYVLLDTGVDPSVIDIGRAAALGLTIDRKNGGEASGVGNGKAPTAYPATIDHLAMRGRAFDAFDALASDLGGLSARYGRRLDAVLGYSFIRNQILLIDYPRRRVMIADRADEVASRVRSCRARWTMPLQFLGDDNTPVFVAFRLGTAVGPATLDTGSNGAATLFPGALDLPGVRDGLVEKGHTTHSGFRGDEISATYAFNQPLGFGPFAIPAGEIVTLGRTAGSGDRRVANIGNRLYAGMKLKILLDYRARRIAFYGQCEDA